MFNYADDLIHKLGLFLKVDGVQTWRGKVVLTEPVLASFIPYDPGLSNHQMEI